MPAFLTGSRAGQTSILDVTVDNGSADPFSESYLNRDILAYEVTSGGNTFSVNVTTFISFAVYISTDSAGSPNLTLLTLLDTSASGSAGGGFVQLATKNVTSLVRYVVQFPGDPAASTRDQAIDLDGELVRAVPEPGALGLIGAGAAGLLLLRLRRRAPSMSSTK